MLRRDELDPRQTAAFEWLRYRTEAMLLLGLGFGKTVVSLTAFEDLRRVYSPHSVQHPDQGASPDRYGGNWRALVVSTKNIVEKTWPEEIRKWEHLEHLTYAAASGRRKDAVLERPDVLGVNFDSLEWFYNLVDADPSLLPDVLIIDEFDKMKSFSANRVKRHCGFTIKGRPNSPGYVHRFRRRWGLSGTPNPEGYGDLWTAECSLSSRRRLGINITQFRARYTSAHWNGVKNDYIVTRESEKQIQKALAPITYAPKDKKYMDLPEPIFSTEVIPWTDAALAEYNEMEMHGILDLAAAIKSVGAQHGIENPDFEKVTAADLGPVIAPNVASMLNKGRQMCSGFVYDDQGVARYMSDPYAKVNALGALRERSAGVPLVVFTQYIPEAEMIASHFPEAQIGLPENMGAWDAGQIPLLVLHPKSAAHGINLQHGSHICVFYSLPWSYADWFQAWGRLHRRGQRKQVSVVRFERPASVEVDVWKKVQTKGRRMNGFIEAMEERTGVKL